MRKIYFDTNQMYYIHRIAEEAEGSDYGNYEWAFPKNPKLVQDIRALCYIVALQYEWDLDFFPSDASFAELSLRNDNRARATQEAWRLFAEGCKDGRVLHEDASFASLREWPISGRLSLDFIDDPDDRIIVRECARERADVLLTSDNHILEHKEQLAELGVNVMRPSEWLNAFLDIVRDDEEAVDFLERILFGIGA